ncbi:MAG: histidine triad nucleotide-binding protein [Candidatus Omnitrophica bacterium]|nr:histidine triad nucleotide-binding protein [Candidatus Omnitrophota bacterium]MBI2174132.1 histidine triad nucleotide-binding protein [Candidatus Omnitrophota bacterium]MBI3010446.1 histidine triad nucleotide-binding protein [Candidatus Omnitrophota bacterium]
MPEADCAFCQIVQGSLPAKIVAQTSEAVAFEDLKPQAPTHLLIIPRRHVRSLADAQTKDAPLLGDLLAFAGRLASEVGLTENGYRVVMNCGSGAGQSVWHLHLHLLGGRRFQWPPG